MSSIKQLAESTSELICSGQVIRNLTDVVKELVENALDSGANSIDIVCKNHGLDGVDVIDNGTGIKENDFQFIAKRHFSSKIDKFEDLKTIQTHGFRGEALSSICQIAKVTIITKHETSVNGSKIEFDTSGRIVKISAFTRQVGTTVQIKDLFCTLTVRQRVFAENFKKDYNEMLRKISNYAIGYQGLRLVCRNQILNKTTDDICVSKNKSIKDNIIQMFNSKLYNSLIMFKQVQVESEIAEEFKLLERDLAQQKLIRIEGFLSNREKTTGRNSNTKHFFFLNNRPIDYKKMSKMISDVYKSFNGAQCPFVLLRIIVPSERIDLNLSPDKYTQNILGLESLIFAIIKQSILKMNEDCIPQSQRSNNNHLKQDSITKLKDSTKNLNNSSAQKRQFEIIELEEPKNSLESPILRLSNCTPNKVSRLTNCTSPKSNASNDRLEAHLRGFGVDISPENNEFEGDDRLKNATGKSSSKDTPRKSPRNSLRNSPRRSPRGSPRSPRKKIKTSFLEIIKGVEESAKKKGLKKRLKSNDFTDIKVKCEQNNENDVNFNQMKNGERANEQAMININHNQNNNEDDNDLICLTSKIIDLQAEQQKSNNEEMINEIDSQNLDKCTSNTINGELRSNNEAINYPNLTDLSIEANNRIKVMDNIQIVNINENSIDHNVGNEIINDQVNLNTTDQRELIDESIDRIVLTCPEVVRSINLSEDEMSDNSIDEILKDKDLDLMEYDKPPESSQEAEVSYSTNVTINEIKRNFKNSFKIDQAICESSRFDVKFSVSQDDKAEEELYRKLNKADFEKMNLIGQFNSGFIIAESDGDIFIIDQHAADERYNFEKVCTELSIKPLKCVRPSQLELTAHDENIIIDNLEIFEKNGFRFLINHNSTIGKRIKLDAVPLAKSHVFSLADMEEIIDSIVQMDNLPADYRPTNIKKMLGYQACRKSIMIGDVIDNLRMRSVLKHLSNCKHPCICAHGRPVCRVLFNVNDFKFDDLNA